MSAPVEPAPPSDRPPGTRDLLTGCGVLALLLGVTAALGWWLFVTLAERSDAPSATGGDAPRIERRSSPGAEHLTRSERRRLEAELEQLDRQIDFAEGQARSSADPGVRDGWRGEIGRLSDVRERLRERLGR